MSVLLIVEHNNKELKSFTLNAVTAASQIDTDVHALVIGNNCGDVAKTTSELPVDFASVGILFFINSFVSINIESAHFSNVTSLLLHPDKTTASIMGNILFMP